MAFVLQVQCSTCLTTMDKTFFIVVKTSQDKGHKRVVSKSKQRAKRGLSFSQDKDQKRVKFKSKPREGLVRVKKSESEP